MFEDPQPSVLNHAQWSGSAPNMANPRARGPFRPRNQGFYNNGPRPQNQYFNGNMDFWCESCDRGFPTAQLLDNHKQQHQKCNIDGCQFIAHPKIITLHIQMQHSSGLFKKISKLNNPEEIEKWRQERRKKYPTKVNIDKKAAELKEKIERGEKMGLKRKEWGKKNDVAGKGQKRSFDNNSQFETKPRKQKRNNNKKPKVLPVPEDNRTLLPFPGILSIILESQNEEEDDIDLSNNVINDLDIEDDIESKTVNTTTEINESKPVVCGALSSLMCEYGSSDEEPEELHTNKIEQSQVKDNKINKKCLPKPSFLTEQKNIKVRPLRPNVNISQNKNIVPGNNDSVLEEGNKIQSADKLQSNTPALSLINTEKDEDDSGPEEVGVVKNLESENVLTGDKIKQTKRKVDFVRKKTVYKKPKPRVPSTLIYKLLSKEMKQERNKVLQCVRYIITNNYFEQSK